MKRLTISLILASILVICPAAVSPALGKEFKTRYTTIHYNQDKDINDFIWRIGGQKLEFSRDRELASSRVDRIIDRVRNILDMQPANFKVDVYLHSGPLDGGQMAFYDYKTRSIHILADRVTDGVFAHEVAHAVINHNFGPTLPSKVQEILTQYSDKYLYSDY